MQLFEWRKKLWFQRITLVLTIVLIVLLSSHPELRLLLPLIDALGLDLLMLLIGAQILSFVRPFFLSLHRSVVLPVANGAYWLAIFVLGSDGPYFEARVAAYFSRRGAVA